MNSAIFFSVILKSNFDIVLLIISAKLHLVCVHHLVHVTVEMIKLFLLLHLYHGVLVPIKFLCWSYVHIEHLFDQDHYQLVIIRF